LQLNTKRGISNTIISAVVIIIIVLAGAGYYFYLYPNSNPAYTSNSSSSGGTCPVNISSAVPSSSDGQATVAGASKPATGCSIGVVFDVGGLGDRGFNDLAYQGMLDASTRLGVTSHYEVAQSTSDFQTDYLTLLSYNPSLIVGVGFDQDQIITQMAQQYPHQLFAQVDGDVYNMSNVIAIKFQENVGSAIVGALAAAMSNTHTIGFIGGMSTGIIYKFWNGYKYGTQWADSLLSKISGQTVSTTLLQQYTGATPLAFDEPQIDTSIAQSMIAQHADVIFTAAGGSGIGALNAIGQYDEAQGWNWNTNTAPPVFGIGVDADQDYIGTQQYFKLNESSTSFTGYTAPSFVLTSEIKKVDVGVFNVMKAVVYGNVSNFWTNPAVWGPTYWTGQTDLCGSFGNTSCTGTRNVYELGWAQGAVGPTNFQYTMQYLTPTATRVLHSIERGIDNGTIVIPENYNPSGTT
jgi:basic membrane protein A and related proteins